jgi:hypothetical protein
MIGSKKTLAAASLATVLVTGVAHAITVPSFTGSDPSVVSPGYPDFLAANYSASLTANSQGSVYTLSIQGSNPNVGVFNFKNADYLVGNESIKLTANFDARGNLLTGKGFTNSYEIDGSLAASSNPTIGSAPAGYSWTAQPVEKLFSATLASVTVDSNDEALGFKSTSFGGWANQKQFTGGGTPSESVWLFSLLSPLSSFSSQASAANKDWNTFLSEIKTHSSLKANTFYGIGSIATVPLPAALLLLGSGLLGFGGIARRRQGQPA